MPDHGVRPAVEGTQVIGSGASDQVADRQHDLRLGLVADAQICGNELLLTEPSEDLMILLVEHLEKRPRPLLLVAELDMFISLPSRCINYVS